MDHDLRQPFFAGGRHLTLGPGDMTSDGAVLSNRQDSWRIQGNEIVQCAHGVALVALLTTEAVETITVVGARRSLSRPGVRGLLTLDEAEVRALAEVWVIDGTRLRARDPLDRQLLRLMIVLCADS